MLPGPVSPGQSPWSRARWCCVSSCRIPPWAPSRLDVFAVTSTGRLAHILNAGAGWSHWESLGVGPYGQATAVASWQPRRLDVFAPSSDGSALRHRWFDGTRWLGPETLAAGTGPDRIPLRGLAAAAWAPGRLDVFSTDARTHSLVHSWYNGRWNGPERLDFTGPAQTVLADPDPRSSPIPVDPRLADMPGD